MSNRHWTSNPQRAVSSQGHGPAYSRDGGKVLNDTETQPKYNENIGPDGPDLNRVGFPTVKAFVKARFMLMSGSSPTTFESMTSQEKADMFGKIGQAVSSIGNAADAADKPAPITLPLEPGRNSGSAPVQTEFSPRVRRSSRGE